MLNNKRHKNFHSLYDSYFGQKLLNFEQETVNQFTEGFYGRDGLLLGIPQLKIRKNTISGTWFIDNYSINNFINIKNEQNIKKSFPISPNITNNLVVSQSYTQLPFQNRSIDLIVASHTLDNTEYPEEVCREFVRVLNADGVLIISLYNPKSIIKYTKNFRWINSQLSLNWTRLNAKRICEWLTVLGLQIEQAKFGLYMPIVYKPSELINSKFQKKIYKWISLIGERWFASMGAVYVLMARKRVFLPNTKTTKSNTKIIVGKPTPVTAKV